MAIDLYELALRFKSEGFAAVSRDMDTIDKKGKGIAKAFTALKATLIIGAVGGLIRKIAVESIEAQKQTAQLNAVLKSTGGVAGVTADDIDKMAGSLQKTTTFSDEAVKSAASLLLTFTSIRGEIFRQTLPAITDMATALGTDLNTATLQVGKALQDPVRGITALRRAGVSFSEAQQDVIKNLVATNRLAEAQGIILKELNVQFGGSAEAARNTLGGALAGLGNAWDDLFEVTQDSSKGIVGAINRIADALPNARPKIDKAFTEFLAWVDRVEGRLLKLQNIAFSLNRFFGGNAQGVGVGSTGGGGGGGRDAGLPGGPPLTMQPVIVNAPKKVAPLGGGGGTGGKDGQKIPSFDLGATGQAQLDAIGAGLFAENPFVADESDMGIGMTTDRLVGLFKEQAEAIKEGKERVAEELLAYQETIGATADWMAETLGDAVQNGIIAAFRGEGVSGAIAAFGKTILSAIGDMMVQKGTAMLAEGLIMTNLIPFLSNPFTAGPALLAAGAALVALGSTLGAISRGGGRGGAGGLSGGFQRGGGASEATRLKFVDRPSSSHNLVPVTPIHFTLVGANDPRVQREIETIVRKSTRRQA